MYLAVVNSSPFTVSTGLCPCKDGLKCVWVGEGAGKSFCHWIHIFVLTVIMDKLEDDCQISEEVILPGGGLAAISIPFKQFWGFFTIKKKIWCGPFLKSLLTVLQYCCCVMFFLFLSFWFFGHKSCRISSPWPET